MSDGKGYLSFGQLRVGDLFRFATGWPPRSNEDAPIMMKTDARWYTDRKSHKFTTGIWTAVTLVKENAQ